MFDFASLNLGKVETLVDVGAGTGAFLGPALEFYKPNLSFAIEMLPDRAYTLWCQWPDSCIVHAAVGEFANWRRIGRTTSPDSSSILCIDPRAQEWFSTGPHGMDQTFKWGVEVRTLDNICGCIQGPIDLMKMDVQGYEGRAIRGGKETLKRTRALIIEVLFCHHYEGQSTPEEIHELLTGLGFKLDRWLSDDWNADRSIHLQGDAFYRRD